MPRKRSADDDQVGYGKPPKKTQFKAGQSGNPKGRPRGLKSLNASFAKELRGRLPINENGKQKKITKGDIVIKQMLNKAAGGDPRAIQAALKIWQTADEAGPAREVKSVFETEDHLKTIANIVRRIRENDPIECEDAKSHSGKNEK